MYVEQAGNGPRAFFGVHGWAGNHRTFRKLYDWLPADASFHSADLPGSGASEPPREWTLDAYIAPIHAVWTALGGASLTVLGYCGGATLALEAARTYRGQVDRVVLIDAFAYVPLYFRVFTWGTFGRQAYRCTFANSMGRRITNGALGNRRARGGDMTRAFAQVNHAHMLDTLRVMCAVEGASRFTGMTVPCDLVFGANTFRAVKRSLPQWRSALPQIRCVELDGVGHEPIRDAPERLAEILFYPHEAVETAASPVSGIEPVPTGRA